MATEETIESFAIVNPRTTAENPGLSVAIGRRVIAFGTPDAYEGAGAVTFYTYVDELNGWGYVGVLAGSIQPSSNAVRRLGASLAVIDDTVVIGAPGDDGSPGRVMIATPPYGIWTYGCMPGQALLTAPKPVKADGFGTAVACCSDGEHTYVAVTSPNAEPPRGPYGRGVVYVFKGLETSDQPWSANPAANPVEEAPVTEKFGACVAINPGVDANGTPDGTIVLAVGAPGANDGQGAVYVGSTTDAGEWPSRWTFSQTLEPKFPDYIDDDFRTADFGTSVAMTGGTTLAVGSPSDPNFELEVEGTGAVWIYRRADGEFSLEQEGGSMYGKAEEAGFGTCIGFPATRPETQDGTAVLTAARHLIVGAPGARRGLLYTAEGPGKPFAEASEYSAFGGKNGDKFAGAVATSAHGEEAWSVVGAIGDKTAGIDSAGYLYAEGSSGMSWLEPPMLVENPITRWYGRDTYQLNDYTPFPEKYLG